MRIMKRRLLAVTASSVILLAAGACGGTPKDHTSDNR